MAELNTSKALLDDILGRRGAILPEIKTRLGSDVGMAPAVQHKARHVAPGVKAGGGEHARHLH